MVPVEGDAEPCGQRCRGVTACPGSSEKDTNNMKEGRNVDGGREERNRRLRLTVLTTIIKQHSRLLG